MLLGRTSDLLVCNYRHFSLIELRISQSISKCSRKILPPLSCQMLCTVIFMMNFMISLAQWTSCTLLILCIFMIILHIKMVAVRQCTHYMRRTPTFKHLTRWDLLERWLKSPSGINSGNSSQEDLLLNPWRSREYCRVSSCYKFCWDDSDYSRVPRTWQLLTNFLVFFDRFLFVFQ